MKIKIIYGTNSGGTRVVSEYIASLLEARGHQVKVENVRLTKPSTLTEGADFIFLGSCTWERITPTAHLQGQLQQHFLALQKALKGTTTPGQRYAIFALGDSSLYRAFAAAADHLKKMVGDLKGEVVGQELRIDNYFFEPEKNQKLIQAWVKGLLK